MPCPRIFIYYLYDQKWPAFVGKTTNWLWSYKDLRTEAILKTVFQTNTRTEMSQLKAILEDERYRLSTLEEQINDMTELHQNEMTNLRQVCVAEPVLQISIRLGRTGKHQCWCKYQVLYPQKQGFVGFCLQKYNQATGLFSPVVADNVVWWLLHRPNLSSLFVLSVHCAHTFLVWLGYTLRQCLEFNGFSYLETYI